MGNCIKISDDVGKHMGYPQEINCAKFELKLKYIRFIVFQFYFVTFFCFFRSSVRAK